MAVISTPVNTPEAWSRRAIDHADPWLACGWSHDGQVARHRAVLEALDPQTGDRMLDWGCGTGELCRLVSENVVYFGFDSSPGMVARAISDHGGPPLRFFSGMEPTHRCFDLVACIGPFNLPERWSKQHTWHTLRHLWATTGCRTLAASLYSGEDEHCLRYTVSELEAAGAQLSLRVEVTRIRENDLLLVVRR